MRNVAFQFGSCGRSYDEAKTELQSVLAAVGGLDWRGEAHDRFENRFSKLPGKLGHQGGALTSVAKALDRFALQIRELQEQAARHLNERDEHRRRADVARAAATAAERSRLAAEAKIVLIASQLANPAMLALHPKLQGELTSQQARRNQVHAEAKRQRSIERQASDAEAASNARVESVRAAYHAAERNCVAVIQNADLEVGSPAESGRVHPILSVGTWIDALDGIGDLDDVIGLAKALVNFGHLPPSAGPFLRRLLMDPDFVRLYRPSLEAGTHSVLRAGSRFPLLSVAMGAVSAANAYVEHGPDSPEFQKALSLETLAPVAIWGSMHLAGAAGATLVTGGVAVSAGALAAPAVAAFGTGVVIGEVLEWGSEKLTGKPLSEHWGSVAYTEDDNLLRRLDSITNSPTPTSPEGWRLRNELLNEVSQEAQAESERLSNPVNAFGQSLGMKWNF